MKIQDIVLKKGLKTGSGSTVNFHPERLTGVASRNTRKIYGKSNCILFEVPFYYIEYGIAQLGAIGLWMQFKKNKEVPLTIILPRWHSAAPKHFRNYTQLRV